MKKPDSPNQQISGWWISLSEEESAIITEGLEEAGFSADPTGLKSFLIEFFTNEEPIGAEHVPPVSDIITDHLKEFLIRNPQATEAAMKFAGRTVEGLIRKIRRK